MKRRKEIEGTDRPTKGGEKRRRRKRLKEGLQSEIKIIINQQNKYRERGGLTRKIKRKEQSYINEKYF